MNVFVLIEFYGKEFTKDDLDDLNGITTMIRDDYNE